MSHLSRMPRPGDEIVQSELRFLALDVQNNRVGKVQIYPLNELSTSNTHAKDNQTANENTSDNASSDT